MKCHGLIVFKCQLLFRISDIYLAFRAFPHGIKNCCGEKYTVKISEKNVPHNEFFMKTSCKMAVKCYCKYSQATSLANFAWNY
jgi:hypothetical protein